jgi:hypothetical protein
MLVLRLEYWSNMLLKRFVFVLLFLGVISACTPSPKLTQEKMTLEAPTPTVVVTNIPKQEDLIFIEFFAGT